MKALIEMIEELSKEVENTDIDSGELFDYLEKFDYEMNDLYD